MSEQLQRKYDRLFELVLLMRKHQRAYSMFRASRDLEAAKNVGKTIDKLIIKEVQERKSNQKQLF